ncbi:MAG TPA: hypothetical protein VEJ63_07240 [Planctomycetota bacterium]|nr:hypothetical protein [Planctomycetota bacterium]
MRVVLAKFDVWKGERNVGKTIKGPSWSDIEAGLNAMDGDQRDMAILGTGEDSYLSVAGGRSGMYMVAETRDNMTFYNVFDPKKKVVHVTLQTGGQLGEFDQRLTVSRAKVLIAAKYYYETGGLSPKFVWKTNEELIKLGALNWT